MLRASPRRCSWRSSSTSPACAHACSSLVPPSGRRLRPGWPACARSYQSSCEASVHPVTAQADVRALRSTRPLAARGHARHPANTRSSPRAAKGLTLSKSAVGLRRRDEAAYRGGESSQGRRHVPIHAADLQAARRSARRTARGADGGLVRVHAKPAGRGRAAARCTAGVGRDRHHGACAWRRDADHRWSVRGDEGVPRGLLPARVPGPRRRTGTRRADPKHPLRIDRGASGDGARCRRRSQQGGRGSLVTAGAPERRPGVGYPATAIERAFREERATVLAALIRQLGDFQLAEDALQDAFAAAVATWSRDGVPARPGAWLMTTARRRAIDRLRRNRSLADRAARLTELTRINASAHEEAQDSATADERLRLIFTCCHPALALEARVALTLRMLGGLSTAEIARAFLVAETTMGQRLTRAKRKIAQAGIPYRVPDDEVLPDRLRGVLMVVYLIFNEGYLASGGERLVRGELCSEAVRLGRLLSRLMPDEAEVWGLLALMLLHDARRGARVDGK